MEELLWSITQESRALQDLRKEIHGIWDDEAAREITSRYLDPHENEDQQMLAELNHQKGSLDKSQVKLESAETYARQAEEHAGVVVERLEAVGQDMNNAYSYRDMSARYNSEARSIFAIVQALIDQANSM